MIVEYTVRLIIKYFIWFELNILELLITSKNIPLTSTLVTM